MNIKIKLLELGKKQVDLLGEIRKRGYPKLDPATLSKYINAHSVTPQAEKVIELCNKILIEWEQQTKTA